MIEVEVYCYWSPRNSTLQTFRDEHLWSMARFKSENGSNVFKLNKVSSFSFHFVVPQSE